MTQWTLVLKQKNSRKKQQVLTLSESDLSDIAGFLDGRRALIPREYCDTADRLKSYMAEVEAVPKRTFSIAVSGSVEAISEDHAAELAEELLNSIQDFYVDEVYE